MISFEKMSGRVSREGATVIKKPLAESNKSIGNCINELWFCIYSVSYTKKKTPLVEVLQGLLAP